ncbi:MAG: hypothetical protein QXX38_02095 [Candidatus Aenigmatarchaeota archaeon]
MRVKKRFFHMRESMKRARAYWQRKIWDSLWKIWKREKRIK